MTAGFDLLLLGLAALAIALFFVLRRQKSLDDTGGDASRAHRIGGFYRRTARQAGFDPRSFLWLFAAGALILALLLPLAVIEISAYRGWEVLPAVLILAALLGLVLAHVWLWSTREERRRRIEWSLPYFLDLIVAFLRSGLGLEEAFRRAGREGFPPDHPLAREVALVAREIDLGRDRPAAFRALAERTGVRALRAVAAALESGLRLGASVEATLRSQAELLRNRRREDTMKRVQLAAIKALVPVVLCGLPLFAVIVFFPAFMEILRTFGEIF